MKKIVKSSLIAILLVAVAIAITGCGAKKDKTYNTLGKTLLGDTYIIELEGDNLSGTDEKGTLTIAKKNGNVLQEVKSGEEKMSIMFKDNTTYLVAHDQKIYMKTEGRDESILPEEDETFLSKDELEALKTQEYKTGGNTFFLLQELKRKGVDKIISKQVKLGKLYIGESAIKQTEEYQKLDSYPSKNCIAVIHDIIVIKLPEE